jgi:quinol monooxygenase YgiN
MIHVIATVTVKPGKREEFLAVFKAIVPTVRSEPGCVEYHPTVDFDLGHPRQVGPRPDVVTVVERWDDAPSLRAHLKAPHMMSYRERVKELVVSTEMVITEDC